MAQVLEVNADNWEKEILRSDTLTVVDFWHEKCPYCKMLEPVYGEVDEEFKGKVKFAKLNVLKSHENQHISSKYGVMGTPTLVFFCDEKPVETIVGFQPKDRLEQLINDIIDKHRECIEKSTQLKAE